MIRTGGAAILLFVSAMGSGLAGCGEAPPVASRAAASQPARAPQSPSQPAKAAG